MPQIMCSCRYSEVVLTQCVTKETNAETTSSNLNTILAEFSSFDLVSRQLQDHTAPTQAYFSELQFKAVVNSCG